MSGDADDLELSALSARSEVVDALVLVSREGGVGGGRQSMDRAAGGEGGDGGQSGDDAEVAPIAAIPAAAMLRPSEPERHRPPNLSIDGNGVHFFVWGNGRRVFLRGAGVNIESF